MITPNWQQRLLLPCSSLRPSVQVCTSKSIKAELNISCLGKSLTFFSYLRILLLVKALLGIVAFLCVSQNNWQWNNSGNSCSLGLELPGAFPRLPKEQELGHSLVKLPLLTTISSVASFCPTPLKGLSWFSVFVSLTENASQWFLCFCWPEFILSVY